jgi:microsomal dipeptidase-like Zn-dependent dipeptidase
MQEHWQTFIRMLSERGLTDEHIGMVLGGNYLRVWNQVLPPA